MGSTSLQEHQNAKSHQQNHTTVQMFGDNQGAITLAKNPQLHNRSKHIDICYHFVRDLVEKGRLQIAYVPTTEMIADGMTKPLQHIALQEIQRTAGLA